MKYFGTDGIRGVVGKSLNERLIRKIGLGIVRLFNQTKEKKKIVIGNDSRISSDYIFSVLCSVLLKYGFEIHNVGVCSSPCLAHTTKKFNFPIGIMISASHNPSEYNGIKFFNSKGEKVDDEFEENFEQLMDKTYTKKSKKFGYVENNSKLKNDYIMKLKKLIKFDFPCVFDCASGGTSAIIKTLFPNQEKINAKPNGKNINNNAGCTHIEFLRSLCIKKNKIGFAFDGDGDRICMVDEKGNIIDGDKIIYILSKLFCRTGIVVGTTLTNSGLEQILKQRNISLLRADIGDKNVAKLMRKTGSILGGENSGHIILRTHTNTGDGLLTAIIIANYLSLSKSKPSFLLSDYTEYCQHTINIPLGINIEPNLFDEIEQNAIENEVKFLIRKSGTEPVLRLFFESKTKENLQKILNFTKNLLNF